MQSQAPMGCNVWSGGLRQKHMLGPHRWIGLGTWGPVMNPVGFSPLGVPIPLDIPSPWTSRPLGAPIPSGFPSPLGSHPLWVPILFGFPSPWVSYLLGSPVPSEFPFPWVSYPLVGPVLLGLPSLWVSCPLQLPFPLASLPLWVSCTLQDPIPWELLSPHLNLCCFPPDLPPVLLRRRLVPHLRRVPHPKELGADSSPLRRQVRGHGSPVVS